MMFDRTVDIYLLGSGVRSFLDVTLITQDVLAKCEVVFYLHDLPSLERYLQKICKKSVNLLSVYYTDGRNRDDIYNDIVTHVLDHAQTEKPAALLLHGHPLVFSSVSQSLMRRAKERGSRVMVFPAVSSLDQIFVELGLDIANMGIQIHNAATAILHGVKLDSSVGCLLLQVGHVLSNLADRNQPTAREEAVPLVAFLKQFYSLHHVVQIVECAVELGVNSRVTTIPISEIEHHLDILNYNSTAYIPALDK